MAPNGKYVFNYFVWSLVVFLLVACDSGSQNGGGLSIPERRDDMYITDQLQLANNTLTLWNNGSGCQLLVESYARSGELKLWLKPTAPCYFIKSPGTNKVQIFQHDKSTRIIAVLGSKVSSKREASRCGREVQGVLVGRLGQVGLSNRVLSGSIYCADQGLDNFQYSLFRGS